jgi:hypothetical protein
MDPTFKSSNSRAFFQNGLAVLFVAFILVPLLPAFAAACPACAPADGENGSGFIAATFMMMGLPLLILGVGGLWLSRLYRRRR